MFEDKKFNGNQTLELPGADDSPVLNADIELEQSPSGNIKYNLGMGKQSLGLPIVKPSMLNVVTSPIDSSHPITSDG